MTRRSKSSARSGRRAAEAGDTMERDDELISEPPDDDAARRDWRKTSLRILLALALIGVGLAGGVMWGERRTSTGAVSVKAGAAASRSAETKAGSPTQGVGSTPTMPGMAQADPQAGAKGDETAEVSLTPEAIDRAGIKTAEGKSQTATTAV